MRESEFLDWLLSKSDLRGGAIAGVGDDCAVLPLDSGRRKRRLLLTTDTIVGDVDFRCRALARTIGVSSTKSDTLSFSSPFPEGGLRENQTRRQSLSSLENPPWPPFAKGGKPSCRHAVHECVGPASLDTQTAVMSPEQVGRKALAISLSDVAAMGGKPVCALVAVAVASGTGFNAVKRLYAGMERLAIEYDLKIAGGDFSGTGGPTVVTTTVAGIVEGSDPVRRSGARPGDVLLVTGALGGSILRKHWAFTPRIKEGLALRTRFRARAMMDISDGLVLDASRLAARSGVGVTIRAASVPVSAAARRLAKRTGRAPLEHALYDGEDFELLVAVEAKRVPGLLRNWRFPAPLTPVGLVESESGVRMLDPCGRLRAVKPRGYEHR